MAFARTAQFEDAFSNSAVEAVNVLQVATPPLMWVDITDYTVLSGHKITVYGSSGTTWSLPQLVEGVDWTAASTNEETAVSLANAINVAAVGSSTTTLARPVSAFFDTDRHSQTRILISGGLGTAGRPANEWYVEHLDGSDVASTAGMTVPSQAQEPGPWVFTDSARPLLWQVRDGGTEDYEVGLTPDLTEGDSPFNGSDLEPDFDLYVVLDATFPTSPTDAVLVEASSASEGLWAGYVSGVLTFSAGTGTFGDSNNASFEVTDDSVLLGKRALIHIWIDVSASRIYAWYQLATREGEPATEAVLLGFGEAVSGFNSSAWTDASDSGAFFAVQSATIGDGATDSWSDGGGIGHAARAYNTVTAPSSLQAQETAGFKVFPDGGATLSTEDIASIEDYSREIRSGELTITLTSDRAKIMAQYFWLDTCRLDLFTGTPDLDVMDFVQRESYYPRDTPSPNDDAIELDCYDVFGLLANRTYRRFDATCVHPLEYVKEFLNLLDSNNYVDSTVSHLGGEDSQGHFVVSRVSSQDAETDPDEARVGASIIRGSREPLNGIVESTSGASVIDDVGLIMGGTFRATSNGRISYNSYDRDATPVATFDVSENGDCSRITVEDSVGMIANKVAFGFAKGFSRRDVSDAFGERLQRAYWVTRDRGSYANIGEKELEIESPFCNGVAKIPQKGISPRAGDGFEATDDWLFLLNAGLYGFCGTRVRGVTATPGPGWDPISGTFSHSDSRNNLSTARLGYFMIESRPEQAESARVTELIACDSYLAHPDWDNLTGWNAADKRGFSTGDVSVNARWQNQRRAYDLQIGDASAHMFPDAPIPGVTLFGVAIGYSDEGFTNGRGGYGWGTSAGTAQDHYTGGGSPYNNTYGFARAIDVTIPKAVSERLLARFSWGAPQISVEVPLSYLHLQVGDVVGFTGDETVIGFRHFTADDSTWEITGKTIDWPNGHVSLDLTWLRRVSGISFDPLLPATPEPEDDDGDSSIPFYQHGQWYTFYFSLQTTSAGATDSVTLLGNMGDDPPLRDNNGIILYEVNARIFGEDPDVANAGVGGDFELIGSIPYVGSTNSLGTVNEQSKVENGEAANHELDVLASGNNIGVEFTQGAARAGTWTVWGTLRFMVWTV